MKQRLIQFSAIFIIFLLSGIGYAFAEPIHFDIGNMSANVTYNETGPFRPGDVVSITADFNNSVDYANISITGNSSSVLEENESMVSLGDDNKSFGYEYVIPEAILNDGPLGVKISPFGAEGNNLLGDDEFLSDLDAFELDPEGDSNITVTYSKTNVIPGDVVNITVDFNSTVDDANILITNNSGSSLVNESMDPLDADDNSFIYNYTIPMSIITGPFGVDINASDAAGTLLLNGEPAKDPQAFVFNPQGYLDIFVTHNGTGNFRPGDIVNIIANFSMPVDHANISISDGLPVVGNANLVGADSVTDAPMDQIDDDTFGYDYEVPEDVNGPLDIDVSGFDDDGNLLGEDSFSDEFNVGDAYITIISPDSEFFGKKCVDFNFTAYDSYGQSGSQLTYTFYLNNISKSSGTITAGQYKQLEFELADGYYTWEIKTRDSNGQTHTTDSRALYVDTKCPSVKLVSPLDCSKEIVNDATEFNFTCEDALAAQYTNLGLTYTLYIDGQVAKRYGNYGNNITGTASSGVPVTEEIQLADGAHNWSVSVQDGAGNSVKSEVRKFYVDLNGLTVSLVSPDGGYVSANPVFNFTVAGNNEDESWTPSEIGNESEIPGAGLPFDYKLLVDGKEVKASCDCDCDCDEGTNGEDNDCVSCSGEDCDGSCFVVGKDIYSIKAAVSDGASKNWTIIITDRTTGKTYQPSVKYFSVDSKAPACVANLNVEDAPGLTYWQYVSDYPGLMVSWNASTDSDLADNPYEVYISTSKPSCIEDMQQVNTTGLETHTDGTQTPNQELEYSEDTSLWNLCIEAIDGKDLIYGKDYWVAVIARDNASNYNSDFSKCGPVRTYEDMDITLEEGWNLKSVPKILVESNNCPEDVFGNGSTVLYWDGSCWQFPKTIEPCKGYWVYTKEPLVTNIQFKGMSSDGTPDVPASLELNPGWHMIGHTSSYYAPWSTTLSSLNDFELLGDYRFSNLMTYGYSEGWGGVIPSMTDSIFGNGSMSLEYLSSTDPRPVGALQTDGCMVPGQGYWIFMKDEGAYASIENSYKPDIAQYADDGTDDGSTDDGTGDGTGDIDLDDLLNGTQV